MHSRGQTTRGLAWWVCRHITGEVALQRTPHSRSHRREVGCDSSVMTFTKVDGRCLTKVHEERESTTNAVQWNRNDTTKPIDRDFAMVLLRDVDHMGWSNPAWSVLVLLTSKDPNKVTNLEIELLCGQWCAALLCKLQSPFRNGRDGAADEYFPKTVNCS